MVCMTGRISISGSAGRLDDVQPTAAIVSSLREETQRTAARNRDAPGKVRADARALKRKVILEQGGFPLALVLRQSAARKGCEEETDEEGREGRTPR